jgi:hypothetical protein
MHERSCGQPDQQPPAKVRSLHRIASPLQLDSTAYSRPEWEYLQIYSPPPCFFIYIFYLLNQSSTHNNHSAASESAPSYTSSSSTTTYPSEPSFHPHNPYAYDSERLLHSQASHPINEAYMPHDGFMPHNRLSAPSLSNFKRPVSSKKIKNEKITFFFLRVCALC